MFASLEKRKVVEDSRHFHVEEEKPQRVHEEILIQVEEDGAEAWNFFLTCTTKLMNLILGQGRS